MRTLNIIKGKYPGKYLQIKYQTCKVDLFITTTECWGCIYFIRTGSADFAKSIVSRSPESLLKFHDGRLWAINPHSGEILDPPLSTPDETDVFRHLGLDYIKPENRNRAVYK